MLLLPSHEMRRLPWSCCAEIASGFVVAVVGGLGQDVCG